ncbi:uncharacterized protein LOC130719538 [Lotus japonicus]|uniref:uncharacterized protein LOC130719538 n=1 Tax=Lotus japonicus TaxID=34305 RepID=UPI00258A2006|nr:uncharacterized protein LOC130719538 [Lotus japonicus]
MGDHNYGRNEVHMEDSETTTETAAEDVLPARKPTFKDKVMGVKPVTILEDVDLLETGIMEMNMVEGNHLFPSFEIDDNAYKTICSPWEDCLVIKLLGKQIGYRLLCERLKPLWKLSGAFEVIEFHNGYFFVKFDTQEDKVKVLTGAPWMIFDHYLSVKPWTSDFVAADSRINTTAVWIRIPGLGLQLYHRRILMTIAKGVGKPLKVDMNTVNMSKGRFARVCVEIDLDQPVVGMLRLRGTWYKIEYEGLHLLCGGSGWYSHLTRNCVAPPMQKLVPTAVVGTPVEVNQDHVTAPAAEPVVERQEGNPNSNPIQPANGNQGKNLANDTCLEVAHGEWLKVERKKNQAKKKSQVKEGISPTQEKGNKCKILGNKNDSNKSAGNSFSKDPATKTQEFSYSTESAHYRKRSRNNKSGSMDSSQPARAGSGTKPLTQGGPSHHQ